MLFSYQHKITELYFFYYFFNSGVQEGRLEDLVSLDIKLSLTKADHTHAIPHMKYSSALEMLTYM